MGGQFNILYVIPIFKHCLVTVKVSMSSPLTVSLRIQYVLATDCFHLGYTEEGHCKGDVNKGLPPPAKLQWEIPQEV